MPIKESRLLLARLRRLEEQALAEVYDAFSPHIYAYALRLLGDPQMAEECVAETFYRLLKALQNGGGPQEDVRPYLYRTAHNWITDLYRRQELLPLKMDDEPAAVTDPTLQDQQFERLELEKQARAALQRLTPDQRLVITLRFVEGLDQASVAQALGKPLSAVKALQHRGLEALRRMLLKKEDEDDDERNYPRT